VWVRLSVAIFLVVLISSLNQTATGFQELRTSCSGIVPNGAPIAGLDIEDKSKGKGSSGAANG
jgi:hypothetical protein